MGKVWGHPTTDNYETRPKLRGTTMEGSHDGTHRMRSDWNEHSAPREDQSTQLSMQTCATGAIAEGSSGRSKPQGVRNDIEQRSLPASWRQSSRKQSAVKPTDSEGDKGTRSRSLGETSRRRGTRDLVPKSKVVLFLVFAMVRQRHACDELGKLWAC